MRSPSRNVRTEELLCEEGNHYYYYYYFTTIPWLLVAPGGAREKKKQRGAKDGRMVCTSLGLRKYIHNVRDLNFTSPAFRQQSRRTSWKLPWRTKRSYVDATAEKPLHKISRRLLSGNEVAAPCES